MVEDMLYWLRVGERDKLTTMYTDDVANAGDANEPATTGDDDANKNKNWGCGRWRM